MTALDGDPAAAEEIVKTLVDEKYIDDFRYASAFARDKASIAGWGEVKIRYMLSSKGITKDTISAAIAEVDDGKASEKLHKILTVKLKSLKDDPQRKMKLLRFALGRGYSYEDVSHVIEELLRIENED